MRNKTAKSKKDQKRLKPPALGTGGAARAGKEMLSRRERMAARMKKLGID